MKEHRDEIILKGEQELAATESPRQSIIDKNVPRVFNCSLSIVSLDISTIPSSALLKGCTDFIKNLDKT